MSALAEALVAAQRKALASLEKAYVAGKLDEDGFNDRLESIGLADGIDDFFLVQCLDVLKEWGASAPAETNGTPEPAKASDKQVALIIDLLKRGNHVPLAEQDVRALHRDKASELITALKDGSYKPSEWDKPF